MMNDSARVLKTFKDEVDHFLQFEYGKKPTAQNSGSGSFLVDITHGIETTILDLVLRESQWRYVSGNEVSVGVNEAIGELGVAVGGGHYYVYQKDAPKEYYPLKFGQVGITGGLAISSPIGVSVNPAFTPSAGRIYQCWSGLSSAYDLNGLYLYVSGSLAIYGANTNTSSIFFLPIGTRIPKNMREVAEDSAMLAAAILSSIAASKAMMVTSGHGFELAEGLGLSLGYGYVYVGEKYTKS